MVKMQEELLSYLDEEHLLEGFVAYQANQSRPLVLLCHAWKGRDPFICEKARQVARLGYVGFALDMYGKGVFGKTKEENAQLKKPFMENRQLLRQRVLSGFQAACSLPCVDSAKIVVLGYGFGAVCALDLARTGADLAGVVSVYGHFEPPTALPVQSIKAKVLLLHGYDDPIAPQPELLAFQKELNDSGVDWQACIYGHTMHAFANPEADDPHLGILYNPVAEKRAWSAILNFLEQIIMY
jgi:dienelactone hydrolase